MDPVAVLLLFQETVFLQELDLTLHKDGGDTQVISDFIHGLPFVPDRVADILRQDAAEEIVRGLAPCAAVDAVSREFHRVEFQIACFSHFLHSFLQLFLRLKQVPFHRAGGDPELPGDLLLLFVLEVVGHNDLPLLGGKVGDLLPEAFESLFVFVLFFRAGQEFFHLLHGDADDVLRRAPVVIAQGVMRHCPDKLSGVLHVIPRQQRPVGLQDDLLGQVFRVLAAFASLQGESQYRFQVLLQDALRFLFPHKGPSFPAAVFVTVF